MKLNELKGIIDSLAKSQGSYGRLKNALNECDRWDDLLEAVNANGIKDPVDLVLFLET